MEVFRIAKREFAQDLSGTGARIYGGRWNKKGTSVIYTSENRALATVEYLVHISSVSIIPDRLCIVTIEIPDTVRVAEIKTKYFPSNWNKYPPPSKIPELGTEWIISNNSLLLRVPSAVVENEHNILINPIHPDMKYVKISDIRDYNLDNRLIKK